MYSNTGCNYLQIHAGGNKSFSARVRQSKCDYQILSEVGTPIEVGKISLKYE